MRELSDEEVFGSTKELSDADVFGPAKSGGGIMDAVLSLFRGGKTPSPGFQLPPVQDPMGVNRPAQAAPAFESVLNEAQPDPSKFNFKEASIIRRMLDDNQERRNQYGTIGPIVGPEVSAGSVATGLLTDLVAGGKGARAGVNQMVGDLIGSERLQEKARKERGQADLMTAVNTPEIESATGRGIYGGLSSLVRNAPSLALAAATRSPAVALGGMAAPMLPEEYGKFRQRGGTPLESLAGAAGNTATEVATELLPMGFLVKQFGRAGAGQFLTGLLAREVPGEQVATLVQDAIDTAVANPDKTWGDYIKERPGAAYQTLIATLTQGGIMGAGNAAVNRLSQPAEKPTPTLADYQDAAAKVFGAAQQPAQQAAPQNVISRVLGQSAPAQDQAAVADRIIAAITGESQQPAVELTDAEVFGDVSTNSQEIDTSAQRAQNPLELEQIAQLVESQARIDAPQTDLQSAAAPQVITTENGNVTQPAPAQAPAITPQPADVSLTNEGKAKTAPQRLGVDNVPMADGGKPFKTKLAAQKAKKLQPMMRVVKVEGGFALADKTPAQLAAEAKAAKRIRGATTGSTAPQSVHEFIAAEGGLSRSVQSDLGIERNVKIGNRWLYAGPGKGMTIEQAAEKLKEAGYIDDELHNTAYDIIRRSINDPQYTPEGWEQVAEAELEAQFEDYLAAEQEAPPSDDWTILTPEELAETGYNQYDEQAQEEIRALVAQAEAMGIDADSIVDDVVRQTRNATQQDYENAAKAALQTAIQGSNGSGRQDSGQAGTEESRNDQAQPEEGLTSYTPQEIEDRLAKLEQAEQERQQQDRKAEQRAEADAQRDDFTLTGSNRPADVAAARGQQDIFSAPETAEETQSERVQYPPVSPGAPAYLAPAQRAVVDFMNGDIQSMQALLEKFAELDLTEAQIRSVTNRIDITKDEIDSVKAMRDSAPAKTTDKIEDLGEKIGGARKDTATSTGRSAKPKTNDERPAWARRFQVSQIAAGDSEGRWVMRDTRTKDWMGQPKQVGGSRNTYATEQEALDAVPLAAVSMKHRAVPTGTKGEDGEYSYEIWRDINDRKRVKVVDQVFPSRVAAMEYMAKNAQAILETSTTFGEADLPRPDNTNRTGVTRRDGDVEGKDFMEAFGFRGVELGNWNNQTERQEVMNAAYDGLMDLAEVMGIPSKAIGLNGDLALAFGARGQGLNSAVAHYERSRAVINLTKMNGAGALAHEWLHALDHYLGRQDGKTSADWKVNADGTRTFDVQGAENDMASGGFKRVNSGVRQELRDAYKNVMETMFNKAEQYVEDTAKADNFVAKSREDVAKALDSLRKDLHV